MSKRRVVITGLGIVSPVGSTVSTAWDNILNGKSGINSLTNIETQGQSVTFGGSVKDFDIANYLKPKEIKKMDTFIHYGMAAGIQAIENSGLEITEENADRIGVAIGSGIGGLNSIEKTADLFREKGAKRISPFFVPSSIINMISGNLSVKYGLKGPNFAIVTACTTGTHNIGDASRLIEYGDADVMVAGGAEMSTTNCGLGGFAAARALSARNDDPSTASRPWDKDRDGFVLGDGAGVVVLEEYEHAKARGATIYAEVSGYGMSGDAYHMTLPSKGGEGAARCIKNTLRNAGINAQQIDYINAHGTSTPAGDQAETDATKLALGEHAYNVVISSTKSMTGHLLGAAGGIEAIFTALAIRDQVAPPTINIFNQDPDCDLDYCANEAREIKIDHAISNSFGFGGTNGTILLSKI
ncbi:beta-ketoacyl-ACP synthase II [bacterium endosymbiont of Bathymodiolus sp. 5 South]|jgi:3-oxoacyl-[acyl-carrier-protein] synthase II|uniref:beta-ketoacyl-ACP synthase II n=1 Tax=bacterium endosymbiont of Bathymodiolus sp. 5 South TaxID=1181670 RepID=UPI0010B7E7B3|nr:beta-ketoacyl-ACP synthase II [bacterium endosymbiont of Bathymodiolus sp. 5 South]CAC9642029.1 3-oxoacyl-[acyl-carrier-protein] synthase, KASII (EC 2.3.1.179) [uncultured Gammaproteobacteria bacterium]CAC9645026.1 3-oxoacyl-[acyl-carrier-protein] synthase, KASII (EC 2.3.1.179) [uncultured Gammaproteobacteria bacterium]SHN90051.1 3-oxoacyl-[acyl-carrier-protein] synthase, KASII [bacterium endosymbiont of Bathymodiolus sp. 5 South]SSC08420.1 3-oxoacyl-[acyl-carrier-protein] synthase, KASII [b